MGVIARIRHMVNGKIVKETRKEVMSSEQLAEERRKMEEIRRKAWPDGIPPVSGCCDRADSA